MTDERFHLLSAYLDGELDATEVVAARQLLEEDAEARAWLEGQQRIGQALASDDFPTVPLNFSGDVLKRLRASGHVAPEIRPSADTPEPAASPEQIDDDADEGRVIPLRSRRYNPGVVAAGMMIAVGLMAFLLTMLEKNPNDMQVAQSASDMLSARSSVENSTATFEAPASNDSALSSIYLADVNTISATSTLSFDSEFSRNLMADAQQNQVFVEGSDDANWINDTISLIREADTKRGLSINAAIANLRGDGSLSDSSPHREMGRANSGTNSDGGRDKIEQEGHVHTANTNAPLGSTSPEPMRKEQPGNDPAPPADSALEIMSDDSAGLEEVILLEVYEDELDALIEHLEQRNVHQGRTLQAIASQLNDEGLNLLSRRSVARNANFLDSELARKMGARRTSNSSASRTRSERSSSQSDGIPDADKGMAETNDRAKDKSEEVESETADRKAGSDNADASSKESPETETRNADEKKSAEVRLVKTDVKTKSKPEEHSKSPDTALMPKAELKEEAQADGVAASNSAGALPSEESAAEPKARKKVRILIRRAGG